MTEYEKTQMCRMYASYHLHGVDLEGIVALKPSFEDCMLRIGTLDVYCTREQAQYIANAILSGLCNLPDPATVTTAEQEFIGGAV